MFLNEIPTIYYIYWLCTGYILIKLIIYLLTLIYVYVIPLFQIQDFKKYGQWAVITGSTDGIGKGFAEELANKGVDICLISRNEEKLQNTGVVLETLYDIKTKYIVANFTDPHIYDHIERNLEGLDIGILVNNVGIGPEHLEPFANQSRQLHRDMLNINLFSIVKMTSIIAPKMVDKKRGLIINVSSIGGDLKIPYSSLYAGCKHFINGFGLSLSYELKEHNVQVTTLIPSFVRTKQISTYVFVEKWLKYFPGAVINVKQLIKSTLITISSGCFITCGYIAHEFYHMAFRVLPTSVFTIIITKLLSYKKNI